MIYFRLCLFNTRSMPLFRSKDNTVLSVKELNFLVEPRN